MASMASMAATVVHDPFARGDDIDMSVNERVLGPYAVVCFPWRLELRRHGPESQALA